MKPITLQRSVTAPPPTCLSSLATLIVLTLPDHLQFERVLLASLSRQFQFDV